MPDRHSPPHSFDLAVVDAPFPRLVSRGTALLVMASAMPDRHSLTSRFNLAVVDALFPRPVSTGHTSPVERNLVRAPSHA